MLCAINEAIIIGIIPDAVAQRQTTDDDLLVVIILIGGGLDDVTRGTVVCVLMVQRIVGIVIIIAVGIDASGCADSIIGSGDVRGGIDVRHAHAVSIFHVANFGNIRIDTKAQVVYPHEQREGHTVACCQASYIQRMRTCYYRTQCRAINFDQRHAIWDSVQDRPSNHSRWALILHDDIVAGNQWVIAEIYSIVLACRAGFDQRQVIVDQAKVHGHVAVGPIVIHCTRWFVVIIQCDRLAGDAIGTRCWIIDAILIRSGIHIAIYVVIWIHIAHSGVRGRSQAFQRLTWAKVTGRQMDNIVIGQKTSKEIFAVGIGGRGGNRRRCA